jgi:predicted NBD/HSP70 family sugar kinase
MNATPSPDFQPSASTSAAPRSKPWYWTTRATAFGARGSPRSRGVYLAALATIMTLVQRADAELARSPGCTVPNGAPGPVTAAGSIMNANSSCPSGQSLQRDLEQAPGRAVRICNDANCLALSGTTDGVAAGPGAVLTVILGTGVGAGVVGGAWRGVALALALIPLL